MGGRGSSSGMGGGGSRSGSRNLPNLSGSEKQVKWANDIRGSALDTIELNIKSSRDYLKRFKNDFDSQVKVDLYESARETYLKKLRSVTSAKDIIDNRNLYDGQRIVNTIDDMARDMAIQRSNGYKYDKKKKRMVKK